MRPGVRRRAQWDSGTWDDRVLELVENIGILLTQDDKSHLFEGFEFRSD